MTKTLDQSFVDWESHAFGFGYGTGEPHTLAALKAFMAAVGRDDLPNAYDYEKLEAAVTPTVAWLLINTLAGHKIDLIDYGTSPRFGWLSPEGERLKAYVDSKTVDELVDLVCGDHEPGDYCSPTSCNCGPKGYENGKKCPNPFWVCR